MGTGYIPSSPCLLFSLFYAYFIYLVPPVKGNDGEAQRGPAALQFQIPRIDITASRRAVEAWSKPKSQCEL